MTDFPPFPTNTFTPTELPVHRREPGVIQVGTSPTDDIYATAAQAIQEEPRRRGPRRVGKDPALAAPYGNALAFPGSNGDAAALADAPAKRKGRPPKAAAVPGAPLSTTSLFQVLAGLQATDVVPLTSCYEILNALPPEDRSRVLGFLNRVLG